MENQANSKSVIINYGLLTGAASILLALVAYAMGKAANPGIALGTISFIIPIVIIVLGIKKFKSDNGGFMNWGQAVKTGIGIALVWGLLALAFQFILENYIDPNLIEQKLEVTRQALEQWGAEDDMIEQQLEKQRNQNPLLGNAMGLLVFVFIGFVVSAIAGAIMKKSEEDNY